MLSEYEVMTTVALLLKERGYAVEISPDLDKVVRPDILGWGTDGAGVTKPIVAVEIKLNPLKTLNSAIAQLKSISDRFGTTENFIFDGESWLKVATNFLGIEASDGPGSLTSPAEVLTDLASVSRLIAKPLFDAANSLRHQMDLHALVAESVKELLKDSRIGTHGEVFLSDFPHLGIAAETLIKACTDYIDKSLGKMMSITTPAPVISFLFNLLGSKKLEGTFLDPFSGSGSMLREFVIRGRAQGSSQLRSVGVEINNGVATLSNLFNSFIDPEISVARADSLRTIATPCDVCVTFPPMGVKLNEPVATPFGPTRNGDIAAIARVASALKPGGVAVMLTTPAWSWNKEGSALREWLRSNFHVVALLSLPPILKNLTAISPLALVFRNATPGETIVGTLGDDWSLQAEPEGELYRLVSLSLQ